MNDITNFPITVYGEPQKFSDTITRGRCRVFYRGLNRNGTYITDDFAEKLVTSAPYAPIKGIYSEEEGDFQDHGNNRTQGRIYGLIPAEPNFAWENHEDEDGIMRAYACFDVLYYTALYPEAATISGKGESMELFRDTLKGSWQKIEGKEAYVITDGCFLGLQILGDAVEPCFEGASFYSKEKTILDILARYEEKTNLFSDLEQGGKTMEDNGILENGEVVEAATEVIEVVEETTETEVVTEETVEVVETIVEEAVEVATEESVEVVETIVEENPENIQIDGTRITELEATISTLNTEKDEALEREIAANAKIEELNAKLASLEQTYASLQTDYNVACSRMTELEAYKNGVEEASKLEVIKEYSAILDADVLDRYREQLADYTRETLDMHLAYECKKTYPTNFSKRIDDAQPKYVPKANESRGIQNILEKYENK